MIAGILLIIMAVATIFAYGYVFPQVEVAEDPLAKWDHLWDNTTLYMAGLAGWL